MNIQNVTVFGAGLMGKQIALNTALYGYKVVLSDKFQTALDGAEAWANEYLSGRVAKGKLTQAQADAAKANLSYEEDSVKAAKNADLVIEAIIEQEDIKRELFHMLDTICGSHTIFVSNSSFIPSSKVAVATKRPEKVANLHYFNPAMVMELVEVVQGEKTSDETIQTLMEFVRKTNKKPVHLKKEIDGFVANRIYAAIVKEAYFLVDNGYVTAPEVDTAVEKGLNHPMGPFRLMDMVGLDTAYLSRQRKYEQSGLEEDKPPKSLEALYKQGNFGRKTGKGWYDYSK